RYLLLDEPTAALDLARQAQAMRLARAAAQAGTGVLAVLHDLNLAAAFADRIALLAGGRLAICAPPDAALDGPRLTALYGAPIRVERGASGRLAVITDFAAA
ncbi:MAG: hemin ABC transporter ATP-binding protein, partial [Pseudomonadota bacterium]|nr:hemin ABC transporter ATP-binding protein [Pseudomonadota bacterium]